MKKTSLILLCFLVLAIFPSLSSAKELPKVAVWDLEPMNTPAAHARQLTSFVVSEITKLKKYEVYSQENVRTLAGWTAERMQLGCTDTKCLTALGQMDIAKLISGSVGKIGKRYTVSLNLFDTQNPRAENAISKTCESEDELIELIQASVRELLGESPATLAKTASGEYRDPTTGMEFILVKGGCFEMGDAFVVGNPDERPGHEVCVKDFLLGKYEVTQGQWRRVMGGNPSHFQVGDDIPVDTVSWNDAQDFIRRLNQMSGKSYRLPTEAEWEYAARSGGKREKWAGTNREFELRDYAWFSGNSGSETHPVGQKKPNGLGLYDMSGNVWEWVNDWYDKDYYRNSPKNDPPGPSGGQHKMLRGGSWEHYWVGVRTPVRLGLDAPARGITLGFRLGLSPR
jgi:sulfatase modifying factor 1